MLEVFTRLQYDGYKLATIRHPLPEEAAKAAADCRGRGYAALTNDCLTHTLAVLDAYGMKGLPPRALHPAPNDWFVFFIGEYQNL
jgi:hypothetical protein